MKRFGLILKRLFYTIEEFDLIIGPLLVGAAFYNSICLQEGVYAGDSILLWIILTSLYLEIKIRRFRSLDLSKMQVKEDDDLDLF